MGDRAQALASDSVSVALAPHESHRRDLLKYRSDTGSGNSIGELSQHTLSLAEIDELAPFRNEEPNFTHARRTGGEQLQHCHQHPIAAERPAPPESCVHDHRQTRPFEGR